MSNVVFATFNGPTHAPAHQPDLAPVSAERLQQVKSADLHYFLHHPGPVAASLETIDRVGDVVFRIAGVKPCDMSVVFERLKLAGVYMGFIGTRLRKSTLHDWEERPAYYAALTLEFEERYWDMYPACSSD